VGLLDKFRAFFTSERCERAIHYDTKSLRIGNLSTGVPPVTFSIGDFNTAIEKVREASEFSELLDNYQYQMCRLSKALGRDDLEWKKYYKIRVGMLNLLTSLQSTLIAFKSDPEGQRARLNDIVGRLQDYVLLINKVILPNMSDLQSKSSISKGDAPVLSEESVTKALSIGDVKEFDANQFVNEL
jgi:hypothetical protein